MPKRGCGQMLKPSVPAMAAVAPWETPSAKATIMIGSGAKCDSRKPAGDAFAQHREDKEPPRVRRRSPRAKVAGE